jgi:hypothetical protein
VRSHLPDVDVLEVGLSDRARECEEVCDPLLSDKRSDVPSDQHRRHACRISNAGGEDRTQERRRAEQASRDAEREAGSVSLHSANVAGREILATNRIDEHESRDAIGPQRREAQRYRSADVYSDDRRAGDAEGRKGALEVVCLRAQTEVGVERPIGLTIAEQIYRVRGVLRGRQRRPDVSPQEATGAEAVDQHNGRAPMAVALDVHGAWPDGDAKEIGVDGRKPEWRIGVESSRE